MIFLALLFWGTNCDIKNSFPTCLCMERYGPIKHTNGPKLCPFLDRRPLRAPLSVLLRGRRQGASEVGGCIFSNQFRNHLRCQVNFVASVSGSLENLCSLVLELVAFRPTARFQLDSSKLRSASQRACSFTVPALCQQGCFVHRDHPLQQRFLSQDQDQDQDRVTHWCVTHFDSNCLLVPSVPVLCVPCSVLAPV